MSAHACSGASELTESSEAATAHTVELARRMAQHSLGQRAVVDYIEDWLAEPQALFDRLLAEQTWEQHSTVAVRPDGTRREVPQGRLMAWAGEIPYTYSGLTLEPRPLAGPLAELTDRLNAELSAGFNHVVLNLYRDGHDHVGRHADCETQLGYEPLIASLSLGAERRFVIEPKAKGRRWRKTLANGSLLVMSGSLQHRFRHSLPRQPSVAEPRINVTWRRMLGPPGMSRSDPSRRGTPRAVREETPEIP